jgi:tRNA U54 and U55 pseudouridine synthase Pus10
LGKHKKSFHEEQFKEEERAEKRKKYMENDLIEARKARNASARIRCDYNSCDQVFSGVDEMKNHIAKVHEGKMSKSTTKMQQDSEAKNNLKKNQCHLCLKVFDHKQTFERHLSNGHEFKCQFCELRFVTSVIMRDHMNLAHPNEFSVQINCPLCKETFEAMSAMQKHLKNEHKKS